MTTETPLDPELLDILVCPLTRSRLTIENNSLVATVGGLRYPIRDGIPILLPESAKLPEGIQSLEEFKSKISDSIPK